MNGIGPHRRSTDQDLREVLEEAILLCGKVTHDHEARGVVLVDDLSELHDRVSDIRRHLANGASYRGAPNLAPPGEDVPSRAKAG